MSPPDRPPPPSLVLARRVREHRLLHGLKQGDLVDRLTIEFGWEIARSAVARIESGARQVNVDELFLLAAALDTTPLLLLTPRDESEAMAPTPRRAMTSGRARAWIGDQVRLWEQDVDRYRASSDAAWRITSAFHNEVELLLGKIAALHGEERIEEIDPDADLSEKAAAAIAVVELQLEFAHQRHNWLTHVGPWEWPDPTDTLDLLERHPLITMKVALDKWGRPPLEEAEARQQDARPPSIVTGQEAAARVRDLVEAVLDVLQELASSVSKMLPAASVSRFERPASRPSGRPA